MAQDPAFLAAPKSAPVLFEALNKSRAVAAPAYFNSLERITQRAMDEIITNAASVEDALNSAHKELEAEIAQL